MACDIFTKNFRDHHKDSSNESLLHDTVVGIHHQKVRKVSGNLSEQSQNSSAKVK